MALELGPLIEHYGYAVTFVGTLAEGETVLILSGLAAHRGYLDLVLVIAVGAVGGMLGDLVYFLIGRHFGERLLARFPRFAASAERARSLIERYPNAMILGVRFMYGLRTVGPAVIGSTRIAFAHFLLLNAVGALLWSACWALAGYLLGSAAQRLLGDLARVERELFAFVIVALAVLAVGTRIWRRRSQR